MTVILKLLIMLSSLWVLWEQEPTMQGTYFPCHFMKSNCVRDFKVLYPIHFIHPCFITDVLWDNGKCHFLL